MVVCMVVKNYKLKSSSCCFACKINTFGLNGQTFQEFFVVRRGGGHGCYFSSSTTNTEFLRIRILRFWAFPLAETDFYSTFHRLSALWLLYMSMRTAMPAMPVIVVIQAITTNATVSIFAFFYTVGIIIVCKGTDNS